MQLATVNVHVSPENIQQKRKVTPAEALILHRMHFSGSQGTPLSGLVITGEDDRLSSAEAARLKQFYTGHIKNMTAFEAVFGSASIIKFPQTFAEIQDLLGHGVIAGESGGPAAAKAPTWTEACQQEMEHLEALEKLNKSQRARLNVLYTLKSDVEEIAANAPTGEEAK